MKFVSAVLSNLGSRKKNEDCVGQLETENCFYYIVADGLGGHVAGEVASRICVDSALSYFKTVNFLNKDAMKSALDTVQLELLKKQHSNIHFSGMRTTVSMLATDGSKLLLAYAGDTRFYHFSGRKLIYQSEDHSVPWGLYECGIISKEQIRYHEDRNRLLRVLGCEDNYRPVIIELNTLPCIGDCFLLCSDGFWELVDEEEMKSTLANSNTPQEWLDRMERIIINRLTVNSDNYSAIAIFVL